MKVFTNKFATLWTAVFLILGFLAAVDQAAAQTKRKNTRKQTRKTTVPQPVRPQPEPVVISQADQYQQQNQQIIEGNNQLVTPTETNPQVTTVPETFDEKIDKINNRLNDMDSRLTPADSKEKREYEEKQKRLLLNLDILTRAEQRSESLRKQLFDLAEKENTVRTKLDTLDYDLRPEMIERSVSFAGSLRPEELREMRKKKLEAEKTNLQNLLTEIQTTRANLELNVQKADQLVEKLRAKLEKDIDDALADEQK